MPTTWSTWRTALRGSSGQQRRLISLVFSGIEDLQAALERYIEVIGEAASKLSQHTRELAPNVPWSQIIGARNVIVHGYAQIEPDRIWDIVKNHLPALRVAVGQLQQLINEKDGAEPQRQAHSEEPHHREEFGR